MISLYERSDIIDIIRMNRLTLTGSDRTHLEFGGRVKDDGYEVAILVMDDAPQEIAKQNGLIIHS